MQTAKDEEEKSIYLDHEYIRNIFVTITIPSN
jgi:hypothetical protein